MEKLKKIREWLDWLAYGKLIFDLFASVLTYKVIKAMLESVTKIPEVWHGPIEWAGALLCFGLLLRFFSHGKTPSIGQAPSQLALASNPLSRGIPLTPGTFDSKQFFRTAYYSSLQAIGENSFKVEAEKVRPNDKESFYLDILSVGALAYIYDNIWYAIYRSQIAALSHLNEHSGIAPLSDLKAIYDDAAKKYPEQYANISFDEWVKYVLDSGLILVHPSNMVEITLKGKDFLKYLLHWARPINIKRL